MSTIINKKATRQYILNKIEKLRPGWDCTCVANNIFYELEASVKVMIDKKIECHPTVGKTMKQWN
jgi:hypothetical protein